jgi:serine protease Do
LGQASSQENPLSRLSGAIRELTARISPAVVKVEVNGYATDEDSGRSGDRISRQRSSGSGVVVDPFGYIMTNAHVIQGAVSVKVLVNGKAGDKEGGADMTQTLTARILGLDRDSDLALLRVDASNMQALTFGDSDALSQGDLVFAIGSPLGLRNSLSMGVISAPARAVASDNAILYIYIYTDRRVDQSREQRRRPCGPKRSANRA